MKRKVYYITNRNLIKDEDGKDTFGSAFTYNPGTTGNDIPRPGEIRVGEAIVEKKHIPYRFEENKIYGDLEKNGSFKLFDNLRKDMIKNENDTIIFIHGFSTDFKDSIYAGAKILDKIEENSNDSYKTPNMLVFSWPSNGKLPEYYEDKYDAELSCISIARSIEKLYRFYLSLKDNNEEPCNQKLHMIVHSMGNHVLSCGISTYIEYNRPVQFFDEVLLMAADEDNDAFDENNHRINNLKPLCDLAKRITIYYNEEDWVLKISDNTKKNKKRLGMFGPEKPEKLPANVSAVDVTQVIEKGEHWYYNNNKAKEVKEDMISVLKGINSHQINERGYISQANTFFLKVLT